MSTCPPETTCQGDRINGFVVFTSTSFNLFQALTMVEVQDQL